LFASCGKQEVYEFEAEKTFKESHGQKEFEFTLKVKARFRIVEEDGICLYDIEDEVTQSKLISGEALTFDEKFNCNASEIEFFDDKDFLLFSTVGNHSFRDLKEFPGEKKTKIVTRALLEKVHRIEFSTGQISLFNWGSLIKN
jgi:hypothetical protein